MGDGSAPWSMEGISVHRILVVCDRRHTEVIVEEYVRWAGDDEQLTHDWVPASALDTVTQLTGPDGDTPTEDLPGWEHMNFDLRTSARLVCPECSYTLEMHVESGARGPGLSWFFDRVAAFSESTGQQISRVTLAWLEERALPKNRRRWRV